MLKLKNKHISKNTSDVAMMSYAFHKNIIEKIAFL